MTSAIETQVPFSQLSGSVSSRCNTAGANGSARQRNQFSFEVLALEKVGINQFKAVLSSRCTAFDIVLPITVTNGSASRQRNQYDFTAHIIFSKRPTFLPR